MMSIFLKLRIWINPPKKHCRLDSDYETFVYTFAAPMTTTISENVAKSHDSIFNVINSDDIIAEMPLSYWGFRHYGNDVSTSVAENYSNEWQSYTSKSYSSNQSKKKELLDSFALLATDRNDCYEFHCSCHGDGKYGKDCTVYEPHLIKYGLNYCIVEKTTIGQGKDSWSILSGCETTAYFMQFLAKLAAASDFATLITDVPSKYKNAKQKFVDYSCSQWIPFYAEGKDNISNPHMQISYYILSCRL